MLSDGDCLMVADQVAKEASERLGIPAEELIGEAWLAVDEARRHPRRDGRGSVGWEARRARWAVNRICRRADRDARQLLTFRTEEANCRGMADPPRTPTAEERWADAEPIWSRWPLRMRRWVYAIVFNGESMSSLAAKEGVSRRLIWKSLRELWPGERSPFDALQCSRKAKKPRKRREVVTG